MGEKKKSGRFDAHGLSRYDFATICEGYELDME